MLHKCKRCGAAIDTSKCQSTVKPNDAVIYSNGTASLHHLHSRICQFVMQKPADPERPCELKILTNSSQINFTIPTTIQPPTGFR